MTLFGIGESEPEIFTNRDVLKDRYHPDEIVGREQEKRELNNALRPVMKGTGSPDNVFISGPAGTGKTALTRSAMGQVEADPGLDVEVAWVNCKPVGGDTQLMLEIANRFRPSGNKLSVTGYSEKQAMDRLFTELGSADGSEDGGYTPGVDADTVLIVLDELDTVDELGQFLYHLPRSHEHGLETEVGVIAISNEPDFIRDIPADVRSTLTDEHIQFSEYDANEIREVLKQRATLAFRDTEVDANGEIESTVLNHSAVALAAAKGTKHTGDARMARDVLRKAGDIALDRGEETVTEDHVLDAVEEYHRSRMVETVSNFSTTAKNIVYALITLHADGQENPRTAEIYTRYKSLLDGSGTDAVSKRQVEKHMKKFERVGLTDPTKHGGDGGNFTIHTLQYDPEHIIPAVDEVMELHGIHKTVRDMTDVQAAALD